jgi:hypothetical protein
MVRALAFAARMPAIEAHGVLRSLIVCGCALALICAGPALPSLGL